MSGGRHSANWRGRGVDGSEAGRERFQRPRVGRGSEAGRERSRRHREGRGSEAGRERFRMHRGGRGWEQGGRNEGDIRVGHVSGACPKRGQADLGDNNGRRLDEGTVEIAWAQQCGKVPSGRVLCLHQRHVTTVANLSTRHFRPNILWPCGQLRPQTRPSTLLRLPCPSLFDADRSVSLPCQKKQKPSPRPRLPRDPDSTRKR